MDLERGKKRLTLTMKDDKDQPPLEAEVALVTEKTYPPNCTKPE